MVSLFQHPQASFGGPSKSQESCTNRFQADKEILNNSPVIGMMLHANFADRFCQVHSGHQVYLSCHEIYRILFSHSETGRSPGRGLAALMQSGTPRQLTQTVPHALIWCSASSCKEMVMWNSCPRTLHGLFNTKAQPVLWQHDGPLQFLEDSDNFVCPSRVTSPK